MTEPYRFELKQHAQSFRQYYSYQMKTEHPQ